MNRFIPLSLVVGAISMTAAIAEVPSLINYQGRLTDSSGDAVTGTKTFAASIYDSATAGNLLYAESVGSITLDNKGIYSFQFGGTGTSNTLSSESIATTDGAATTFQKVLTNTPIIADSLSVTDGTYTWSQTAGSTNEDEFGVIYSSALGRATVIYYNGAPAAGADITATYRYGATGITGALSSGAEHWLQLSVDGVAQTTRDRVLAVPFAARAGVAESLQSNPIEPPISVFTIASSNFAQSKSIVSLPYSLDDTGRHITLWHVVDSDIIEINSSQISVTFQNLHSGSWAEIRLLAIDRDGVVTTLAEDRADDTDQTLRINGSFPLKHQEFQYVLSIKMNTGGGGIGVNKLTVSHCRLKGVGTK